VFRWVNPRFKSKQTWTSYSFLWYILSLRSKNKNFIFMQDVKLQLAGRLKDTGSVLVSVSNNPSVDQLAASLALTLMLTKLGKHATAVFGGEAPPVMSFLHPEQTIKKNTDSLRDFIISLDKEKADKLRYKLEDQYVKIFITPYNTTLSEKDLMFSQGEVNVEVVVALGVHTQEELDKAIVVNGRILHDATVATITTKPPSSLGSINWSNERASSLCEMLCELADALGPTNLIDTQIANALLTGIVAETNRFSNEKTSSVTMSISSKLLSQGANQQLVATQLSPVDRSAPKPADKKPATPPEPTPPTNKSQSAPPVQMQKRAETAHKAKSDGDLKIEHIDLDDLDETDASLDEEQTPLAQVSIDEQGNIKQGQEDKTAANESPSPAGAPQGLSEHPFMAGSPQAASSGGPANARYQLNKPGDLASANTKPSDASSVDEALKSSTSPSATQFVSVGQDGVRGLDPNLVDPESDQSDDDSEKPPPPFAPPIIPPPST
jgi:hypothetical protein